MSHPANSQHQESKVHRDVLDAALQLFSTKGFAATSVREVVEKAGVTKPALYYHFGSKEGLLRAIVEGGFGEYEQQVRTAVDEASNATEAMIRLVQAAFEMTVEKPALAAFMYRVIFGSESDSAGVDVSEIVRRNRALVMRVIDTAVREGVVAQSSADRAGLLLNGLLNIHTMAYLKGELSELNGEIAAEAVELYLSGVARGSASVDGSEVEEE